MNPINNPMATIMLRVVFLIFIIGRISDIRTKITILFCHATDYQSDSSGFLFQTIQQIPSVGLRSIHMFMADILPPGFLIIEISTTQYPATRLLLFIPTIDLLVGKFALRLAHKRSHVFQCLHYRTPVVGDAVVHIYAQRMRDSVPLETDF